MALNDIVRNAVTYGSTCVIDASLGEAHQIQVTNSTAFTIANPINPPARAAPLANGDALRSVLQPLRG